MKIFCIFNDQGSYSYFFSCWQVLEVEHPSRAQTAKHRGLREDENEVNQEDSHFQGNFPTQPWVRG